MTQAALAKALGIQRSTVSDWERGAHLPRGEALRHLSEVLGVAAGSIGPAGAASHLSPSDIPVLGSVAAGEAGPEVVALVREAAESSIRLPDGAMALRVKGDSMTPVALDGQWVICDTVDPVAGDLVVCEMTPGAAVFRRLALVTKAGSYVLEALNPAHGAAMEVEPPEIVACYRVIGVCFIAD